MIWALLFAAKAHKNWARVYIRTEDPDNEHTTDGEDVECENEDFMTEKEFDHAHRTELPPGRYGR